MFRRIAPVVALSLGLLVMAPGITPALAAPASANTTSAPTPATAPAKARAFNAVPKAAWGSMPKKAKRILNRRGFGMVIAKKRIVAKGAAGRVVNIVGPGKKTGYRKNGKWYYQVKTNLTVYLSTPPKATYDWRTAVFSVYGGPSENQSVAGPYPSTGTLDSRGFPYFAHKSMAFGTRVIFRDRVGHTIVGVCVDRGPYVGNREFDLSPTIANALGLDGTGTIQCAVLK